MMVLPAADVEIVDTWSTMGMRGTGSHDFTVDRRVRRRGVVVHRSSSHRSWTSRCCGSRSCACRRWRSPPSRWASPAGALDEIVALASGKVPMFADAVLAANPLFRNQLGRADAALRAARAALRHDAAEAWTMAPCRRRVRRRGACPVPQHDDVDRRDGGHASSTRPTERVVARRCTTAARCNGGCATSTP